jgi:hypothetical protein
MAGIIALQMPLWDSMEHFDFHITKNRVSEDSKTRRHSGRFYPSALMACSTCFAWTSSSFTSCCFV